MQAISGGLTPDNIGVEYAGTVFAIAESRLKAGLLWAGTSDGLVHGTQDGGGTWTNVTGNIPDLPPWGTVSNIEPSRYDTATAYLANSHAHLFAPRQVHRFRPTVPPYASFQDPTKGQNPPYGASINYYFRSEPTDSVKLEIQNEAGETLRNLDATKRVGVNRVWWDLEFERTVKGSWSRSGDTGRSEEGIVNPSRNRSIPKRVLCSITTKRPR